MGANNIGSSEEAVGGVFALETLNDVCVEEPILSFWSKNAKRVSLFHNARSAIRHIIIDQHVQRIWLPSYLCADVIVAIRDLPIDISFYTLDLKLNPNLEYLESELDQGDFVLVVNYFGRPQCHGLRRLVRKHTDVSWIEDCSHTIDIGVNHFGDYRVYSARKLLGVPDGGVLVDMEGRLTKPDLVPIKNDLYVEPYRLRAEEGTKYRNDLWYSAFRYAEQEMRAGYFAMSELSKNLLTTIDIGHIKRQRRENYLILYESLQAVSLYNEKPKNWVPFGFPMLVDNAPELQRYLAKHKIFAARHWVNLVTDESLAIDRHPLSKKLITLPCDQRYDGAHMTGVVKRILEYIL